jgi:chromosomal replication initiator protein
MDNEHLWQATLSSLELAVSPAYFKTWFRGTNITKVDGGVVEVGCPSLYVKSWLEERHAKQIANSLSTISGEKLEVNFIVTGGVKKRIRDEDIAPLFEAAESDSDKASKKISEAKLNPRYTLENFVIGNNNQLAHAVAQAIISSPGKVYNPFFLYGGVGVGKTHLMQAVGHALLRRNSGKNVVYCTGEAFTNEMIEAIQNRKNSTFRSKYREVDLLLIDDIQFIAGRDGTQEEFFHTFNALHGAGKQVVMTSDRPPKEIAKLEERLRSRFEWGMIADIQAPDKDMRVAILSFKCRDLSVDLPFEVANLLAEKVASVRDLEGALMRVITTSKLSNEPISLELAARVLGVSQVTSRRKAVNPKEVLSHVAEEFELKISDLRGARRFKEVVVPRQVTMYLLRTDFKLPLTSVANMLGGRDHTTIMHGVERCEKLIDQDQVLRERVEAIREKMYG